MKRITFSLLSILIFLAVGCGEKEPVNPDPQPESTDLQVEGQRLYTTANAHKMALASSLLGKKDYNEMLIWLDNTYNTFWHDTLVALYVSYPSADPFGNAIRLSGCIYLNKAILDGRQQAQGLIVGNHYTIAANKQCPSKALQMESLFAISGYIVCMADYYGFGSSVSHPQAYMHDQANAQASIDLLRCFQQYMLEHNILAGNKLMNVGYSQGGGVSVSVQKYADSHPELGIAIDTTYAGAGPYDVAELCKYLIAYDQIDSPVSVALVIVGMNHAEQLGLDLNAIFKEPLRSHYEEWLISKQYTMDQVMGLLGQPSRVSDIFTQAILDTTSSNYQTLLSALYRNSLTHGWTPNANDHIFLFHSTQDNYVNILNMHRLVGFFQGCGFANYETRTGNFGSHSDAALNFYPMVFDRIN